MAGIRIPATQSQPFALQGGLDLVTPRISLDPGRVFDAQNYEPLTVGGYRRINGYERYDGRTSPTSASYWALNATITGTATVGATLTGATSGATGIVLGSASTTLVLGRVTGTFVVGEALQIAGVTVATATSQAMPGGAATAALNADWKLLAANDRRADIGAVPGSGAIRGIFVLADTTYAFRDNAGGTANLLYKATPTGWSAVSFGQELLFKQRQSTVTITIASPGVFTWTGHGLAAGRAVQITTTGALPTGITAGQTYYVLSPATNTFQLAATPGGSAIVTTGTQSGTHTAILVDVTGVAVGATVTGVTSGATATVAAVLLRVGTWTVGPAGSLVLSAVTGTFASGEALSVGGVTQVQADGANTAITRAPGGRCEVMLGNFTGSSSTRKAYGVDGVNTAFEFDGTTYVPIHTGMTVDTPTHVEVHKNKLFLAFASSVQYSTTNNPYAWTAVTGAAEIGMGDVVTALSSQTGNSSGTSLAIFTAGKAAILYGSASGDFQLVPSVYELGYLPNTVQAVSNNTYGLTARGVQSLITTLNYGDFSFDALSFLVQPLISAKYALATASVTLRSSNQYRLFFSDGTGLVFGLTGEKLSGILPVNYGKPVRVMWNSILTTGQEVTYFGSDDGYVYQDNVGTSFDGAAIEAWIRPAFNNLQSSRMRKRFRRAVFEVASEGFAKVNITYDLGYANPNVSPAAIQPDHSLTGGGGFWEQFAWDSFTWDAAVVQQPSIPIDGTDNNIGFVFYSSRAQDDPHTVQGGSLNYSPRHLARQ